MRRVAFVMDSSANHHPNGVFAALLGLLFITPRPEGRAWAVVPAALKGAAGLLLTLPPVRTPTDPCLITETCTWRLILPLTRVFVVRGRCRRYRGESGRCNIHARRVSWHHDTRSGCSWLRMFQIDRWLGVTLIVAIVANLSTKQYGLNRITGCRRLFPHQMALICALAGFSLVPSSALCVVHPKRWQFFWASQFGFGSTGSAVHLEKNDRSDLHRHRRCMDGQDMPPSIRCLSTEFSFNHLYHSVADAIDRIRHRAPKHG